MEAGHYKRARALVEARLHAYPNDAYALYLQSKIRQSFGDLPGAIAAAQSAVALEPPNADFHAQLAEVYAYTADEASWLRGINFVRLMKHEISAALALDPKHTDTLLVSMMFSLRAPRLAGGDKKKALVVANEIIQNDPRWGYLAEARLMEDSGDDAQLGSLLKRAVSVDPSHYRAHIELARFYCCVATRKDFAAAEREAKEAMKLDERRAGAYDVLSRVYASTHRWAELDATLAQSEKMVPDDLAAFFQAASILSQDSNAVGRASRYIGKYLCQEPEGREPTRSQALALQHSMGSGK